MFTTVQDLGRFGFGPLGVSASGAADSIALRLGNRLVGNPESSAALEMTLLGGIFVFPRDAIIAVTGSDFGSPVPMWTAVQISAGTSLAFGGTRSGARCYLCVRGGISVPLFLGSASTHILSGLGGLEGRALRKGDTLAIGESGGEFQPNTISQEALRVLEPRKVLRVTAGPQENRFSQATRQAFYGGAYRLTDDVNRMGLRLDGPAVVCTDAQDMITEPVALGAIQATPGWQPIILFVEQQTTGGYPIFANVISADLPSVGQLRPRDEVHFELVTIAQAIRLFCEQEELLRSEDLFLR